jgi:hypothetical protein
MGYAGFAIRCRPRRAVEIMAGLPTFQTTRMTTVEETGRETVGREGRGAHPLEADLSVLVRLVDSQITFELSTIPPQARIFAFLDDGSGHLWPSGTLVYPSYQDLD